MIRKHKARGGGMIPYEPEVYYNCDDYDCCRDGSPQVICKHCKQDWPCDDYQTNHTAEQTNAQKRWVVRVKHRVEYPDLIEYNYREQGIEAARG
jgi:hypothetical protein